MAKYPGTLLPRLNDPKDSRESRKAVLDLLKKINDTNTNFDTDIETLTEDVAYAEANGRNFKNTIINGDFQIWQRGSTFPAASTYGPDRFGFFSSGVGAVTLNRSTDTPSVNSPWSLEVDVTTADTTIAAADFYLVAYGGVEGYDATKYIDNATTLSFWVKSPKSGVHCVAFRNSGFDRSFVAEYNVASPNIWEKKSVTLPAGLIQSGSWDWTNGAGLRLAFILAGGTTFQTSPETWQTGNFIATANQVNCMDSTGNNFYLSQVQLELGEIATEFERRPIGVELESCQRYYEKSYDLETAPGTITPLGAFSCVGIGVVNRPIVSLPFRTKKRTSTGTATLYSRATGASGFVRNENTGADVTALTIAINNNNFDFYISDAAVPALGDYLTAHWTIDDDF